MAKKRLTDVSASVLTRTAELMQVLSLSEKTPPPNVSELLVRVLNENQLQEESKARLVRIFQLLQCRQGYRAQLTMGGQSELHGGFWIDSYVNVGFELNEALGKYSVTPQIDMSSRLPEVFYTSPNPSTGSPQRDVEASTVLALIQLAERDQLSGIRQCWCEKFFLTRRIDQYHCSPTCRIKAHHASDEFKAKRREADRARYRLHRDAKVKETTRRKNVTHKTR